MEMTDEWEELRRSATLSTNDAALMEYLMKYCPNDPHVENDPGPDA